jgi:hypothetical protein
LAALLSLLEYFPYKERKTAGNNVADAQTGELETALVPLKIETQQCKATSKSNFC